MSASEDGTDEGSGNPVGEDETTGNPIPARENVPEPSTPMSDTDDEEELSPMVFVRDFVGVVVAVLLVGGFLFAASGVWPPMVAIESHSMTPHLKVGDLVFVMEEHRFPGEGSHEPTGVVTARQGRKSGYVQFGNPGDVIVYAPNGNANQTPIIHRAMFWVEKGERWYDEANPKYVGSADDCNELTNCPAPHSGFITKGDSNPYYDQVGPNPFSGPVKPEWVVGTAEARIPWLGCIRLASRTSGGSCQLSTAVGT